MNKHIRASVLLFVLSLVICCIAYPVVLWAIGSTIFADKAAGTLIRAKGADGVERVIGSRLIAQPFTSDEYFWPRPSAPSYNAAAAGGSNWGANNPKLRDRAAQFLGTIIKYKSGSASAGNGPEPHTPQQDIEAWFAAKPDRVADWANEYSVGAAAWAKTDYDSAKDKYGLQGEFILAWTKDHPGVIEEWKKANPTKTDDPKPEDMVSNFFASYASANPGKWPGVVETERPDKTKEKKIAPVTSDSTISANFFDMWLQDSANASKVADLEPVPADMVTASGAGLDPHITLRNALSIYQLNRVAEKRTTKGSDVEKTKKSIAELVRKLSFTPLSGLAGEPLVNVLELNVELDAKFPVSLAPSEVAANLPAPTVDAGKKEIQIVPAPKKEIPVALVQKKDTVDVAAAIRNAQSRIERGDKSGIDELKKLTESAPNSLDAWSALANGYLAFGQFRPAASAFLVAAARSSADSDQEIAARAAARDASRWAGLERFLPQILAGGVTPMSSSAWADFGQVCRYTRRYAAAARFFEKAANEGSPQYGRLGATSAALAGFNQGTDAKELTDAQRRELRQAALNALSKNPEWRRDPAFAALKDPSVLGSLSSTERTSWQSLWAGNDQR